MNWKYKLLSLRCISALLAAALEAAAAAPAIIPLPQKMEFQPGSFVFQSGDLPPAERTKILVNTGAEETGHYLAAELRRRGSVDAQVTAADKTEIKGNIELTLQDSNAALGEEGYALTVAPEGVTIRAGAAAGLFYGV